MVSVESVARMLLHKSQQLLITPLSCLLYSRCISEKIVVSVESVASMLLYKSQQLLLSPIQQLC